TFCTDTKVFTYSLFTFLDDGILLFNKYLNAFSNAPAFHILLSLDPLSAALTDLIQSNVPNESTPKNKSNGSSPLSCISKKSLIQLAISSIAASVRFLSCFLP